MLAIFVKAVIMLVVSIVLGESSGLCLNLLGFKSSILQKGIKKIPELTKCVLKKLETNKRLKRKKKLKECNLNFFEEISSTRQ